MSWGALRDHFVGTASKRLTAHEVNPAVSNGHEFQGVSRLRELLGSEKRRFAAKYLMLRDDSDAMDWLHSEAVWYDARERSTKRSAEWRLYYPSDASGIQARMSEGDLMVIARTRSDVLLVLLAQRGSIREAQLKLLFQLPEIGFGQLELKFFERHSDISFIAAGILEEFGVAVAEAQPTEDAETISRTADLLTSEYPNGLPTGKVVAERVQHAIQGVNSTENPDGTLVRWMEAEEAVFRQWEDGVILRRLESGFRTQDGHDVQAFRDFSMSLRQSRVSRAGGALQYHTARILKDNGVAFEEQIRTEHGERPDFLFPGKAAYHDEGFASDRLRMLAVKFTARDRWRQVLNEARRIPAKHLLTMDAAISMPQLKAMRAAQLQPVIPLQYINEYGAEARDALMSFRGFIREVQELDHNRS